MMGNGKPRGAVGTAKPSLWHRRRGVLAAGVLIWSASFAAGWWYCGPPPDDLAAVRPEPGVDLFAEILLRNVGVASALWLSGLLTAGIGVTAVALAIGAMAGFSWGQALPVLGLGSVVRHVMPHMLLELLAIGIAVGAGLVPLPSLWRTVVGAGRTDWRVGMTDSGRLWGLSLVMLTVAAGVETWIST
ncbi:stage II sporulation protein M [Kitasatospora sp. NPDC089509]|uniref:stage II sporulation protein M n=1 Tax=Kitasatospora sp. NPDC089509 TaxID=3364079 RepID=UPI00381C1AC1